MIMANTQGKAVHIDTAMHRASIVGRDTCNGTCEQACGCTCVDSALPVPTPAPRVPRDRSALFIPMLGVISIMAVAVGAALALWGWK